MSLPQCYRAAIWLEGIGTIRDKSLGTGTAQRTPERDITVDIIELTREPIMARSKKPLTRTPPTVKGQRFSMLRIHCEQHPNDAQSARHLTHTKWNQYR